MKHSATLGFAHAFIASVAVAVPAFALEGMIGIHDPSTVVVCDGTYQIRSQRSGMVLQDPTNNVAAGSPALTARYPVRDNQRSGPSRPLARASTKSSAAARLCNLRRMSLRSPAQTISFGKWINPATAPTAPRRSKPDQATASRSKNSLETIRSGG